MATAGFAPAPTASILVNVFDGARQPLSNGGDLLVRIRDGNQREVSADFHENPSIRFQGLPFFNNFGDNYTVVVSADGFKQAGFTPVKVSPAVAQRVDVMLLPHDGHFNFRHAGWLELKDSRRPLFDLLAHGASSDQAAQDRYEQLMETNPAALAGLLNITTAMTAIHLPNGSPLDSCKEVTWDDQANFPIQQDRFYAFADIELVNQVKLANEQGTFAPAPGLLHQGATSSYKQIEFGEANVQLTFHENDKKEINGTTCVIVEPDIDYFKDPLAHIVLEVLPNSITHGLTDPKEVYVLRWMAGRRAGIPEFNPLYTIEA